MKTIHRERLEKLADYLDQLPRRKFVFDVVIKDGTCGSVGCAIGHCPNVFPELVMYDSITETVRLKDGHYSYSYRETASRLFDLTFGQAGGLFGPHNQQNELGPEYKDLGNNATPKQVAKLIRQFLRDPDQE